MVSMYRSMLCASVFVGATTATCPLLHVACLYTFAAPTLGIATLATHFLNFFLLCPLKRVVDVHRCLSYVLVLHFMQCCDSPPNHVRHACQPRQVSTKS